VVTLSGYAKRLVIEHLGVAADRVSVVPVPLDHQPSPDAALCPDPGRPVFVYPAMTHPHKNHATLVRAFSAVVRARPEARLVLTGGRGAAEQEVRAEIERLDLGEAIDRPGRVPRADLEALLAGATALVFPSEHEGYGLPVAEAMALGCPVIASNVTALPEVVGDAGLLVDPDDVDGWTAAMLRLIGDAELRLVLVERGRRQVSSLTPEATAEAMLAAYRAAAGSR
jgi:alpha-1,3-rhamnosyl/mannosyltransferase